MKKRGLLLSVLILISLILGSFSAFAATDDDVLNINENTEEGSEETDSGALCEHILDCLLLHLRVGNFIVILQPP